MKLSPSTAPRPKAGAGHRHAVGRPAERPSPRWQPERGFFVSSVLSGAQLSVTGKEGEPDRFPTVDRRRWSGAKAASGCCSTQIG